jgi:orotate phosphoribosyltransferase-like protein
VDTIARVRRAFHVQSWSVKKITRELNVSRNTVRKILRSDATEFSYKREHQPLGSVPGKMILNVSLLPTKANHHVSGLR